MSRSDNISYDISPMKPHHRKKQKVLVYLILLVVGSCVESVLPLSCTLLCSNISMSVTMAYMCRVDLTFVLREKKQ